MPTIVTAMPIAGTTNAASICCPRLKALVLLLAVGVIAMLVGLLLAVCIMVVLVEERTDVIGISDVVSADELV